MSNLRPDSAISLPSCEVLSDLGGAHVNLCHIFAVAGAGLQFAHAIFDLGAFFRVDSADCLLVIRR